MSYGHDNQGGQWQQPGSAPSASEPSDPYGQPSNAPYSQQPQGYGQQAPYGQQQVNPYDQPAAPAYGQYGYGQPYGMPMEHPQGTLILVLGILGFVTGLAAPVAWYMGSKTRKEIAASGVVYSNEGNIKAGHILGMVMSIIYGALIVLYIVMMIVLFGIIGVTSM